MANRLADATSPYLQQHRDNPVDWWEWGPAAFAEARGRDVPIFLSVGYAACHWCHVMAHESFEDEDVAAALNGGFVAIKVDREERPDVDAVYLAATQALTGQGGWPMSVLLDADGTPFWAGTYLPKPALLQLLGAASDAWANRRDAVLATGSQVAAAVRAAMTPAPAVTVSDELLARSAQQLAGGFDPVRGGFGGAPKFPPSMVLEFLLRHHARTGDRQALAMAARTCEAMARGGIYDQLAGGFARYAVDAGWVVPHFEKMLYDNALLARVYGTWWTLTGSPLAQRIARETADFLLRDLTTDEGGFASALDADTSGVEGLTYVWTPEELAGVLGAADGVRAAELLRVTAQGTFEHGRSTLQLPAEPEDAQWWAGVRARLTTARAARPQPARDDKVVTSWNGLAIAALADLGATLGEPRYLDAATAAADLILSTHIVGGRLRRSSRAGRAGGAAAVADDYGNLAEGLLALSQATGSPRWSKAAGTLLETAVARFVDPSGVVHDTPKDGETLVARPHSGADNAEPSGQSALAGALLRYGASTGSTAHLQVADAVLQVGAATATREPRFAGWTLATAEARLAGPVQVAVVGTGPRASALLEVVRASASPGLVYAAGLPDTPGFALLAGRPLVDGEAAAYVCRGFVCDRPVTDAESLRRRLALPS